jgi:hypothetical protein
VDGTADVAGTEAEAAAEVGADVEIAVVGRSVGLGPPSVHAAASATRSTVPNHRARILAWNTRAGRSEDRETSRCDRTPRTRTICTRRRRRGGAAPSREERPMAKFVVGLDTAATPDQVRDALIDFTERRTEIWKGLSKKKFEVYEQGEQHAIVREGNDRPDVWARERYDWSKPGVVRWDVIESNFCNPGSYVQVSFDHGANGGTHAEIEWSRTGSNTFGKMVVAMMKVVGPMIIKGYIRKSLDAYAKDGAASRA